jgi:hypothetical protein
VVNGFGRFPFSGPAKFSLPVIGRTGSYANVRGYVDVRDLGNGNQGKSNIEFHLLP